MIYFNLSIAQILPIPILEEDPTSSFSLHTDVQSVTPFRHIGRGLKARMPLVIVATVLACAFVLFQFRSPLPAKKIVRVRPTIKRMAASKLPEMPAVLAAPIAPLVTEPVAPPVLEVVAPKPPPPTPPKVVAHLKRAKKKLAKPRVLAPQLSDEQWEALMEESHHELAAVDLTLPLSDLIQKDLAQENRETPFNGEVRTLAYAMGGTAPELEAIAPVVIQYGEIQKDDFADVQARIASLRQHFNELEPVRAPSLKKIAVIDESPLPEPELVKPVAKVKPKAVAKPPSLPVLASAAPVELAPVVVEPPPPVPQVVEESPVLAPTIAAPDPDPVTIVEKSAVPQATAVPLVTTASLGLPLTTQSRVEFPVPSVVTQTNQAVDGDSINGKLWISEEAEQALHTHLRGAKWHVELYLHPVNSRDGQDTVFVDYQFPAESFRVETKHLQVPYRLVAGFYAAGMTLPIAQVICPDATGKRYLPISSKSHQNVAFEITAESLVAALKKSASASKEVVLSLTVFEGASGNFRDPHPIKGAQVSLIGFPNWGPFTSDGEGNVRLTNVPIHSELLLRIDANGYYPSHKVIPILETNVYSPVYLIGKEKVETITKYFTQKVQEVGKSIIMGRVFNPETRLPASYEIVSLAFRLGKALYFGAFPDPWLPATTELGLFGFFNVQSSFRSVQRGEGKPSLIVNVLPDTGHYVQFGAGGSGNLDGVILDPFHSQPVNAKVKLVGDSNLEVPTNAKGEFQLSALDFEPGILTLEVQADGYPVTWFTVPWNVRHSGKPVTLYMMERELVKESAALSKVQMVTNRGTLVGGAEESFFKGQKGCVRAKLVALSGLPLPPLSGPFSLSAEGSAETELCLTAENPGFIFHNLEPDEYQLILTNGAGETRRAHVARVGRERVSIVVN